MEAAIFGLLGTAIGGAITIVVAIIKFRQEISLWKEQFRRQSDLERDKLKLERYSSFLGAYYYINGAVGDLIDILEQNNDTSRSRLSNVVSDPAFAKACDTINNEKGWIALLSTEPSIVGKIGNLEKCHDELFTIASKAKDPQVSLSDVLAQVRQKQKEMNAFADVVAASLKFDAKCA